MTNNKKKPEGINVSVQISKDLHDMLKIMESEKHTTISAILREGLTEHIHREYELYLKTREYRKSIGEIKKELDIEGPRKK